jgi:hypothetical protein
MNNTWKVVMVVVDAIASAVKKLIEIFNPAR